MDASECMKSLASVRGFSERDVTEKEVEEILRDASAAPSAGNIQDWRFIAVRNQGNRKRLASAAFDQHFLGNAPVIIVVCSDMKEIGEAYGERGKGLFSVQDAAAAAQNLLLSAWNRGLGGCWVGSFDEKKVREILVLPEHVRPLVIIPLGYPKEKPRKHPRKSVDEILHKEFY